MSDENNIQDSESTDAPSREEIADGKFFAAIGYFSFLCFVPLFFKKDNSFAMFHGKQALVLFILELAAGVISVIPILGSLVSWLAYLAFIFVSLFAIYKVLTEEKWEIPYIYEISKKISL